MSIEKDVDQAEEYAAWKSLRITALAQVKENVVSCIDNDVTYSRIVSFAEILSAGTGETGQSARDCIGVIKSLKKVYDEHNDLPLIDEAAMFALGHVLYKMHDAAVKFF